MNINSMSKIELEAYAREKYDVELDRRLSKTKLLKEVAALDNAYHAPEAVAAVEVKEVIVEKIVEVPVPAKESGETGKMLAKVIKAYEAWIGSNRDRNTYRMFAETVIEAKKLI